MLLFHKLSQNLLLEDSELSSVHIFLQGAINALQDARPKQRRVILADLATQIGCDPQDLYFLTQQTIQEESLELPNFREAILA